MAEDCANPLYAGWLKEWQQQAESRNSKGALVYRKAYQSMKACTAVLQHGSEAKDLSHIGPKLCKRLEDRHAEHCEEHGLPVPKKPKKKRQVPLPNEDDDQDGAEEPEEEQPKKKRKQKEYIPQLRSGAYALMWALGELDEAGKSALSKRDLIDKAQPHCDSNFSVPNEPGKFYTAWKSMETLEKKELVCTRGHPTKRYQLTDDGWDVARRMRGLGGSATVTTKEKEKAKVTKETNAKKEMIKTPGKSKIANVLADAVNLLSDSDPETEAHQHLEHHTPLPKSIPIKDSGPSATRTPLNERSIARPIVLQPGTFEVKLVLDNREVRTVVDRDYISKELRKHEVVADTRALPLGDVLWIAKIKPPFESAFRAQNRGDDDEGSTEIVLEHVIERKRLDDLISSLKDGRFHEQKFRLKKSGMRHVTYLVETVTISAERQDIYGQSIDSAIASMQIVDDIFVKQTQKMDETIRYLARMTRQLKAKYEAKELHVLPSRTLDVSTHHKTMDELRAGSPANAYCITFSAFCSLCDKSDSLTLRDLYLKMLMCQHGVTGDKAIEIQKIWKTPNELIEAYSSLGNNPEARKTMISVRLGKEINRKQVTKILSTKIAEVWAGG